jgi:hypothetical protein
MPSAHMQFSVERLLADSCARSGRPNDCRGTCEHIQLRVVHNYANDQSISRSMDVYDTTVVCALLLRFKKKGSGDSGFTLFIANVWWRIIGYLINWWDIRGKCSVWVKRLLNRGLKRRKAHLMRSGGRWVWMNVSSNRVILLVTRLVYGWRWCWCWLKVK